VTSLASTPSIPLRELHWRGGDASVTFITHLSKKIGEKGRDFEPLDGLLDSLPLCHSHFDRHKFLRKSEGWEGRVGFGVDLARPDPVAVEGPRPSDANGSNNTSIHMRQFITLSSSSAVAGLHNLSLSTIFRLYHHMGSDPISHWKKRRNMLNHGRCCRPIIESCQNVLLSSVFRCAGMNNQSLTDLNRELRD
jgi:hypothetical protein